MAANSHEGDEVARPYHHGQLREALIAASMERAEEGGPEAISIRDAARRAGVAANAAYRHFEDLNHLRAEVALRARGRLREAMQAELEARPRRRTEAARAKEQLSAVGRGYIRFALQSPNLFRCAWMDCLTTSSPSCPPRTSPSGHWARCAAMPPEPPWNRTAMRSPPVLGRLPRAAAACWWPPVRPPAWMPARC